jgi:hypothetical protein
VAFSSANASPQYHRLSQLFPLLEGGEFDELVEDVRRHGVREAIWLYEEKILDGRNRQRAAAVAGFPVRPAPMMATTRSGSSSR